MTPMLAFRYQDRKKHLTFPCFVQPKLNGIRMMSHDGKLQSRSHGREQPKEWAQHRLMHLRKELASVATNFILDGELYLHGWSLQKINGAAAVNATEDRHDCGQLEYHVFDVLDIEALNRPFEERRSKLLLLNGFPFTQIKFVLGHMVFTEQQAEQMFAHYKLLGYEGMMYRQADAPYGIPGLCTNKQNRWNYLLKRKDWLDDEFEVIGTEPGEGKYEGMCGSLVFAMPNGKQFTAGSGLSDREREDFQSNPPLGRIVTVKYEMLSDSGVPLKPTILEVHE